MANPEHLEILKKGVEVWNNWRAKHRKTGPDLSGVNLARKDLSHANFSSTVLSYTNLSHTNLSHSMLNTNLVGANLEYSNLTNANLRDADLAYANLSYARFNNTILTKARIGWTKFGDTDLSEVKGLDSIHHDGPSVIGIDTLYRSNGNIPKCFLQGCGVPDEFIIFLPDIIEAAQPIKFYSCFISYNNKDVGFARHLYSRLHSKNLRVWYAPEEMKGGRKLHEQIFSAIQVHDKVLLVLSENSLQSEWVMTEIRRARKTEREENRRKLFPIRLVDFDVLQKWECFDADTGKDLAIEVREYFIPDFSNWKDHDSFEKAFSRLLRDLKAEEK